MFKRIAALLALAIFLQIVLFDLAKAGNVEFQAKDIGVWRYTTTVGFGEKLTPHFGWTGFVLSSNTWGEAYFGPTYSPAPWVTVAVCAGIQDAAQKSRFATWYSLNYGHWSLFHVMEDGNGRWHKLLAMYSDDFGRFGYWDQDALGRGPRLELKLPGTKTRASVYGAVLWDGNQTRKAFGLIKAF